MLGCHPEAGCRAAVVTEGPVAVRTGFSLKARTLEVHPDAVVRVRRTKQDTWKERDSW